jgi:hypothetical protein
MERKMERRELILAGAAAAFLSHSALAARPAPRIDPLEQSIRMQMRELARFITERPRDKSFTIRIGDKATFTIAANAIAAYAPAPGETTRQMRRKQRQADKAIEKLVTRYVWLLAAGHEDNPATRARYCDHMAAVMDKNLFSEENGTIRNFSQQVEACKKGQTMPTEWVEDSMRTSVSGVAVRIDTAYRHNIDGTMKPREATTFVIKKILVHSGKNVPAPAPK